MLSVQITLDQIGVYANNLSPPRTRMHFGPYKIQRLQKYFIRFVNKQSLVQQGFLVKTTALLVVACVATRQQFFECFRWTR